MKRRDAIKALKARATEPLHPEHVKLLVEVLIQADKIAIREGIDAHTKLVRAIDNVLKLY